MIIKVIIKDLTWSIGLNFAVLISNVILPTLKTNWRNQFMLSLNVLNIEGLLNFLCEFKNRIGFVFMKKKKNWPGILLLYLILCRRSVQKNKAVPHYLWGQPSHMTSLIRIIQYWSLINLNCTKPQNWFN